MSKNKTLEKSKRSVTLSLLIAIIATAIDQIVHIINFNGTWTHQIYLLWGSNSALALDTFYYVFAKFGVVVFISFIVLLLYHPKKLNQIITTSVIIAILSGVSFAIILSYMSPYYYSFWRHLFHAFAYGIASFIVLYWRRKK